MTQTIPTGRCRALTGLRQISPILAIAMLVVLTPMGAASAQGVAPSVSQSSAMEAPPRISDPAPGAIPAPQAGPVAAIGPDHASIRVPHDLSPWGMFLAADIVVKGVMLGLAIASLVTWTVWLAKGLELLGAKRRIRQAFDMIGRAGGLAQVREAAAGGSIKSGPAAAMIEAAHAEARQSESLPADGIKERVAISLSRIEARAGRQMARGTGVLATIGSVAPFVGLFGTVWGIMNAFIGISQTQTTNLAVVAPGIAEALLATAIGLVAAIPAVVIYNVFARSIAGYRALLADVSAEVMRHLSRDLDRRMASVAPVVALQTTVATVRARKVE